jgi:hypothetical protein
VAEVPKPVEKPEKTVNTNKNKRKGLSSVVCNKDEKSSFSRMYNNTCEKIQAAAERISTSVEASSASPGNVVPTIKEVMKMVKDCGVQEGTALMHTTTSLIMKPKFREVFSSLETNEGRLDLL